MTTAAKKPSSGEPDDGAFDFWDGDLAPREDVHPLQQSLPNSVWEKFNKHRELLGKPKTFLSDHLKEAEARGEANPVGDSEAYVPNEEKPRQTRLDLFRRRRKKGSLQTTAEESTESFEAPHADKMSEAELKNHLIHNHGLTGDQAETALGKGFSKALDEHQGLHSSDSWLAHHHGQGDSGEHPHHSAMNEEQVKQHLIHQHGIPANSGSLQTGLKDMQETHGLDHKADEQDYHQLKHTHTPASGAPSGKGDMPHPTGTEELKDHLQNHHGVGDWEMEGMEPEDVQDTHDAFHESTAYSGADAPSHTHAEGVAEKETVGGSGGHSHTSMTPEEMEAHLLANHALKPPGVEHIKDGQSHGGNPGASPAKNMEDWHHDNHDYSTSVETGVPHDHGGKVTVSAPHPPAKTMGGKQIVDHLKGEHGLSHNEVYNVMKSGGDKPTDGGVGAAQTWHDAQHAAGEHSHSHKVFGEDGPEQLKHPSKYTNSSLHGHLLEDHGINPSHLENAINGALEGTDNSHIVHMLHNEAHAKGQSKNPHEHEGWSGGPEVHKGHQDVAQPFWGAPPNTAQKSMAHLTASKKDGGHGMDPAVVASKSGAMPWDNDADSHKAYENMHGNLHEHGGADLGHQHVPTIQPGVKSPQKIKKEKLAQHLKDYHGIEYVSGNGETQHGELHDPDAFAYKGHPGHEHPAWDQHGPVTQELPSAHSIPADQKNPGDYQYSKPFSPGHHDHPANMSHDDLLHHIQLKHSAFPGGKSSPGAFTDAFFDFDSQKKSHEQLLQEHALAHAKGDTNGHTHEAVGGMTNPLEDQNAHYGGEPEIQTKTHPAIENDHDALTHMIKHHPNVTDENYSDWHKGHQTGTKPSMVKLHDALHNGGTFGDGSKLPKVLDGHDHADPSGPPTSIAVGSHLVHEHGMSQDDVAAMTPAEFKAHHEQLHLGKSELDIGHGHEHPGGPMRDPRVLLPNTHHEAMRDDSKHVSTQEWYHGTGRDYDGPPKNATELKHDTDEWGNFGGGDWNNHIGTHWTSLHEMAQNFNHGGNRIIHAKLHMANPIKYNSLNHMTHDAYERLHASGHMQDDGEFLGNHNDDIGGLGSGCCSGRLLEYAKGHHRDDGKFGLEAYRDSLRASGHDGIHVRNQADFPQGHWNAIPLSADQIEITHGGCRGHHDDGRDNDVREFERNESKLKKGWVHPKEYDKSAYTGELGHHPTDDEVSEANAAKHTAPTSNKTAIGRGDSDKYLTGEPEGEGGGQYCNHCEEHTDHDTDDCPMGKWCSVCEEHGDHEADDENSPHEYCEHCDAYADHDGEACEEDPGNWSKEAYCPHCDESHKENQWSSSCHNCHEDLPDWGKLQTFGKPVKPHEYQEDGEADTAFGHASMAKLHGFDKGAGLASHLYHHHKSDVSGKEFDKNDEWDEDALQAHHQWLHQNPKEAKSQGFEVEHEHKNLFGQFKKKMTPEETQAHVMLSHIGSKMGGAGSTTMLHATSLSPDQAVELHKKMHAADDAVQWGEKDGDGDLIGKATHTHNLDGDQGSFDEGEYPKGDHLITHLQDKKSHMAALPAHVTDVFKKHPKVAEALHTQLHQNQGPSAEPGVGKYHIHTPEMLDDLENGAKVKDHLVKDHGANPEHNVLKGKNTEELMDLHHQEHTSAFPTFKDPDHVHKGGTSHKIPAKHTAETMKKKPEPEPEPPLDLSNHKLEWPDEKPEPKKQKVELSLPVNDEGTWGKNSLMAHIDQGHKGHEHLQDLAENVYDTGGKGEAGLKALKDVHEAHKALHEQHGHPDHYHYDSESKIKPEASRKILSDLFEEVAL